MKKAKSFLGMIIVFVVIGLLGLGVTTGFRVLNENNNNQRNADISLNTYIKNNQELPVGKYVSLNLRWVLGPFGTYTTTSTTNLISATSNVQYWYFVVLEDGSFMALATSNKNEQKTLDRMSDWLTSVDGFPTNGETTTVQGELRKLTNNDMLKIYNDYITGNGVPLTDSRIRYVVLDTSAGREQLYFIIAGTVAVIAVAVFIFTRIRKKKNAESVMGETAPDNPDE